MRSLSRRPRKEDSKKEEVKEVAPVEQVNETQPESLDSFDESVVIS